MLGFAPIASATLADEGRVAPITIAGVGEGITTPDWMNNGLEVTASLAPFSPSGVTVKVSSTISTDPVRKPETMVFSNTYGWIRIEGRTNYDWDNVLMLGMRDKNTSTSLNNYDGLGSPPVWDEAGSATYLDDSGRTISKNLSFQTKVTSEINTAPIVSQDAFAPVSNGEYTYPATTDITLNSTSGTTYSQAPKLYHLPSETISSNAATITSLSDSLSLTLEFPPASDPTYLGVIVGQFITINTFDPSNTDTYFGESLITASVQRLLGSMHGVDKYRVLQRFDEEKGFFVGTLSTNTFGTDKTNTEVGAALVGYKYIIPDSDSQSLTLNLNGALSVPATLSVQGLNVAVSLEDITLEGTADHDVNGKVFVTKTMTVDGFSVGTVGSFDPEWHLNTAEARLVAEPNEAANSNVYPYLARNPVFDYTVTVDSGTNSYGSGNKFYMQTGYDYTVSPTLRLSEGKTYKFDQSDPSNGSHPLRFSTTANGTHGSGSEYTTGVTTSGTPGQAGAYTQIVVASGAPTLHYYCTNHSGMGGQANIATPQHDFDITLALGILDSPIAATQIINNTDATNSGRFVTDGVVISSPSDTTYFSESQITLTLGSGLTAKSVNVLPVTSQLVTSSLGNIQLNVTEIIPDSATFSGSVILGDGTTEPARGLTVTAESKATCTSRLFNVFVNNVTFAADANVSITGLNWNAQHGNINFRVDCDVDAASLSADGLVTGQVVNTTSTANIPATGVLGTTSLDDGVTTTFSYYATGVQGTTAVIPPEAISLAFRYYVTGVVGVNEVGVPLVWTKIYPSSTANWTPELPNVPNNWTPVVPVAEDNWKKIAS